MAGTFKNIGSRLYRLNSAIVPFKVGSVLVFRSAKFPDVWQFPQGGIEEGESPLDCALRELYEETGISSIGQTHEGTTVAYDYIKPMKCCGADKLVFGQIQTWFAAEFTGAESEISLPTDELSECRWESFNVSIAEGYPKFKREAARKGLVSLAKFIAKD
jgi:putative (di)nucleoside polyphosphate hydrolase